MFLYIIRPQKHCRDVAWRDEPSFAFLDFLDYIIIINYKLLGSLVVVFHLFQPKHVYIIDELGRRLSNTNF